MRKVIRDIRFVMRNEVCTKGHHVLCIQYLYKKDFSKLRVYFIVKTTPINLQTSVCVNFSAMLTTFPGCLQNNTFNMYCTYWMSNLRLVQ